MKKILIFLPVLLLLLAGCQTAPEETAPMTTAPTAQALAHTEAPVETTVATEPPKEPLPEDAYEFVKLAEIVPEAFQYL